MAFADTFAAPAPRNPAVTRYEASLHHLPLASRSPIVRSLPSQHSRCAKSRNAALLSLLLGVVPSWSMAQETSPTKDTNTLVRALKDLDGHFPFAVPESKEAWETRAHELRQQLEMSLGLFPRPKLAPVQPVVHSRRVLDGYAIEKVYFESLPGLFVTGSLYTPALEPKAGERRPAVLCPHGHWTNGRFYYTSDADARKELAVGAERFESAAHSPLQARCVQLARMGIVVFHYDMMGNADNQQIGPERIHGFGNHGPNPEVAAGKWLLYSPKAEGLLQNVMGMQTINTLQSLEFLLQRTDVDPTRISITGASGGGTQTFIATAIEPRFAGAYPVVMVSASMQGGCTCENAVGLRVDTGNVEIAALTAPRPLGVNAANDWTRDMGKDGFPELKRLYGLYDAGDKVVFHSATHFPHNYNHVTRVPMYGFMNRLFGLGLNEPVLEQDFPVLKDVDMTVWDSDHPKPRGGIEFETELLDQWAKDIQETVNASPDVRRQGWEILLQPANRIAKTLTIHPSQRKELFGFETEVWPIVNAEGVVVGEWFRGPKRTSNSGESTIVRLFSSDFEGDLPPFDWGLVPRDAYGIDSDRTEQSLVKNPRQAACFTYGYNPPLFVRRLAVLNAAIDQFNAWGISRPNLSGDGDQLALAAAAQLLRHEGIGKVVGQSNQFDFDQAQSIRDPHFLPGAMRFGGIQGLIASASEDRP